MMPFFFSDDLSIVKLLLFWQYTANAFVHVYMSRCCMYSIQRHKSVMGKCFGREESSHSPSSLQAEHFGIQNTARLQREETQI